MNKMLREFYTIQCKSCNELRAVRSRYTAKDALCFKCANAKKIKNYFRVCRICGDVKKVKSESNAQGTLCNSCRYHIKKENPIRYYHFCPICSSSKIVTGPNKSNYCIKHKEFVGIPNKYVFDFSTMQTVENTQVAKLKAKRGRRKTLIEKVKRIRIRKPKKNHIVGGIDGRQKVKLVKRELKQKANTNTDKEMIHEWLKKNQVRKLDVTSSY